MTVYGVDFHPTFQSGLDVADLRRAGMAFALCKVTEGSGWYRKAYHSFSDAAKANGLLFSAYHFLRSESSGEAQAAHCRRSMGDDWGVVPVMLDWETSVDNTWADAGDAVTFVNEVRRLGGRIHLNYLPHWYWDRISKPNLATGVLGSLALIQSSYVAGTGTAAVLYPGDASTRWNGFGGAKVSILQFSSNCQVPAYPGPLDINAYRGTRAQLAATGWFHDPNPALNQEDDVAFTELVTAEMIGADVVAAFARTGSGWSDMRAARLLAQAALRGLEAKKAVGDLGAAFKAYVADDAADDVTEAQARAELAAKVDMVLANLHGSADPVAIARAIVDVLPADLAQQVVHELGTQLAPAPE